MKFIKCTLPVFLFIIVTSASAKVNDIPHYFQDKEGCFILYNVTDGKIVEKYNPEQCAKRISPNSTFKIALSVMAFDQNIIDSDTTFIWNDQGSGSLPEWNDNQTPKTWLEYSVVWVSQELTPQLGLTKIKEYLDKFNYGNQDFSGTPGEDDGLTNAWLSNSLKISADEQLELLKRFTDDNLGVSRKSIALTKQNMFLQHFKNSWKLYGKTGSGRSPNNMSEGWFVGFIQNGNQEYIFVTNVTNLTKITDSGGLIAKDITLNILSHQHLK